MPGVSADSTPAYANDEEVLREIDALPEIRDIHREVTDSVTDLAEQVKDLGRDMEESTSESMITASEGSKSPEGANSCVTDQGMTNAEADLVTDANDTCAEVEDIAFDHSLRDSSSHCVSSSVFSDSLISESIDSSSEMHQVASAPPPSALSLDLTEAQTDDAKHSTLTG